MTTAEIELLADPTNVAVADLNLKTHLRYNVVPEFMEDCGYVVWRRKTISAALAANANYADIMDATYSFSHMRAVYLGGHLDSPLTYIGEDPVEVIRAKSNTVADMPSAFYIESSGSAFNRIGFNCLADIAYTVWLAFEIHVKWPDLTSSVNMDIYIPQQFQWGLVSGLRKFVYRERYGIDDPRYVEAASDREKWVAMAKKSPEMARKTLGIYLR